MSGVSELQKIAEGREAEIFAWEDGAVLRLMRNADAQPAVDSQSEALKAAHEAGVKVPQPRGATSVDGRPGLIMDRLDGLDLLTLLGRKPWTIFTVARISGELHAGLHEVIAPDHLPNLKQMFRERIGASERVPAELRAFALARLAELPDGDRLCHGDFHPGNLIQTDTGAFVIDWTAVMRGDPMADFARTALLLSLGEPPPGAPFLIRTMADVGRGVLLTFYRRAYKRPGMYDDALAKRWQAPVTAYRLVEPIEEEKPKLLKILEELKEEYDG